MLPVSLDYTFLLPLRYSLTFICPVSCIPYVASFSGLSFFIAPSVFSNMYLSCVLCTLCCQFLDSSFLLPLRYSLTFICPVSCVPYVASFSGLSFFITPSVFSTFICHVSCVPYVASFSIFDCPFGILSHLFVLCPVYPMVTVSLNCPFVIAPSVFVLCLVYPMLPVSLDCPFFIAPSVFSNIYLSCVLCTLCCQFLWIVIFHYPFGIL